jgi:peptide/nickel transport system substrate-binding protein
VAPLPFDPAEAARLLEAEGWSDADGDGVREKDGVPLAFELLTNQRNPVYGDIAQVIQAQLAVVGAAVTPRLLEWQTVLSMHRGRDFDAVLTNWVLDNFRVDPRPLYGSDQAAREGSANRSSYASPVADSLMDLGTRTSDDDEAREAWTAFARLARRDQPITLLFWQDELAGVSDRLEDVRMDARGELVTLPRWRWRDTGEGRR